MCSRYIYLYEENLNLNIALLFPPLPPSIPASLDPSSSPRRSSVPLTPLPPPRPPPPLPQAKRAMDEADGAAKEALGEEDK